MSLPLTPQLLAVLAELMRRRPADAGPATPARGGGDTLTGVLAATGPFAPTGYSRARLLRQMYASGLLADGVGGAPNSLVRGDPVDCRVSVDFRGSQR